MVIINQLVKKAQKGDEKAYIILFKKYEEDIYRMAYMYVRNQEDALDIVQETAYKSFDQIKTLKQPEYFKSWLIRIAINTAINQLRKKKNIVHLRPDHIDIMCANEHDVPLQMTLKELIEGLNENEKSVLLLKFYADYTINRISGILDMPIGTVKTILYRSLEKLRKQLNKEDIYEQ
ncbi:MULTISPECIES: sigma-70 family RNA polymerase sigma factor [Virgibacillus]|uniref:sigma-70 family RNA polymerase sigma factor n=1 Tax=Virgibacillus TaxID=84406 RepID=UPI00067CDFC4|nr:MULTISPECIES: sigma-70 family RNA polymerase sigma factor [Virgibacillus]MEB5453997.1 sigma-70 family RNA polymerase sigma factor [Virgibacillus pantothenticus]MEB5458299.1 sigma-70 family RNA polymerase sigma factor [Virgibacillus pantothenticus]MEB5462450.1 sigma-70 family RNA polymerase sigma factor [Virgibacillus pantothenticus]MEB5466587.1 sigma-70 family RNA polymerase sigma factor [Virgibacillus pantothenticus]MEB5470840.1 sigma-70 family RNA polymerase sigma factor [Virgibacillus pa